jgi:uncharacterized RDD family membrane protein YckC
MVERGRPRTAPTAPLAGGTPASLLRRFVALLLDWMLCLLISGIFANPVRQGWAPVVVLIGLYGFFIGLYGQTPGMWLAKIGCVGLDGRPVGLPRALLRGVLLALVVPALILDRDRRGLHDRAAGTIVIARPTTVD